VSEGIPLARPSITDSERSAAQRVLSTSQLTGGPEGLRFESLLAKQTGRRHALATSSGTSALELALRTLSLEAGDRVLVTAFGFPAAANLIADRGAIPVAVDVDEHTWLMDFALARKAICARTKAVVTIDQLGAVTRAADILALEADTGVPVISDAACGFGGSDQDGKPAGSAGRFSTLSFHPRKVITTGEGGAIVCDDEALNDRLRSLRNHGQVGGGKFSEAGTNARLSELSCAIGLAQLARLQSMLMERRMLVEGYKQRLATLAEKHLLAWQELPEGAVHANQTFAVRLSAEHKRDEVVAKMAARGIACGAATYSFAEIEIHKNCGDAANARALHERALALPLYLGMRSGELDRVSDGLREALQ
jgi:dTDP-4-amino-4,6-dideoxygalactose transaminase